MAPLTLRALDATTERELFEEAYSWRTSPKRNTRINRMSFDEFATDYSNKVVMGLFSDVTRETSTETVSVVHSQHEESWGSKDNVQPERMQQSTVQRQETVLSDMPRRVHAGMAQDTPADTRTTDQGQRSELCERVPKAWQVDPTTLRGLSDDRERRETSRRLQQAAGCSLDVPTVPSRPSQCPSHPLLLAVYVFIETSPKIFEGHFTSRRDANPADVFAGARTMVNWFHSQGAIVTAEIVKRNRPLRAFVEALGFVLEDSPCQEVNVGCKVATVKYISTDGLSTSG